MITHFLSVEQVDAYCRDFVSRLYSLGDEMPKLWIPIGQSGINLFDHMIKYIPRCPAGEFAGGVKIQPVSYKKSNITSLATDVESSVSVESNTGAFEKFDRVSLVLEKSNVEDMASKRIKEIVYFLECYGCGKVLLIDSSIHSGSSMFGVREFAIKRLGAAQVVSYSLLIKQSSAFIPDFFGLIIGDHDRALFLLNQIPNNRLAKKSLLPGLLRRLVAEDIEKPRLNKIAIPSIAKLDWSDLWYSVNDAGHLVYVLEKNDLLIAFIDIKISGAHLTVNTIAVDGDYQKQGISGALMRWIETLARSHACTELRLNAIKERVPMYRDQWHYECVEGRSPIFLGGNEEYVRMKKPLLYHFPLPDLEERPT